MDKKFFKKNDLILIGLLIGILAVILIVLAVTKTGGNTVTVSVDGQVKESFPLSQDREYVIDGYNGGTNTLVIENGSAYVKDSSCPDHLCEKMGKINLVGQSVICLPNRVTVEITGHADDTENIDEYDTIVGG